MSAHVTNVDESDFEEKVLEKSNDVPVVVDFWAPWCGPCRALSPILEELAAEGRGSWILAKVNSDENPNLSRAFNVRGIPQVIAFVGGRPAAQFTGALPREAVESFLRSVIPSEADRVAARALDAAKKGDMDEALALWDEAIRLDPTHDRARVHRARALLASGRTAEAEEELAHVSEASTVAAEAQSLRMLVEWGRRVAERGGIDAIRARAADDPDRAVNRYDYGCALAVVGDFENALAEFLEVVRRDRKLEDDGGRKAMVAIFAMLGDSAPLTREYRTLLSREIY
jgi:putative thioredoxin